jgi:uroporphyrin-III C-methyltransferase
MAGKQLAALARRLLAAGWDGETPASVVSRAGWPDQLHSEHTVATLGHAAMLHAGRPTVVTVGAGAAPIVAMSGAAATHAGAKAPPASDDGIRTVSVETPAPTDDDSA